MEFREFTDEIIKRLRESLPEHMQNAEIYMTETKKINQTYPAMIVKAEGDAIAPSIDMARFYEKYQDGMDMDDLVDEIRDISMSRPETNNLGDIQDYESAKDKLFIRVSDAGTNSELLENVPHKDVHGLAMTVHILVDLRSDELGSVMVNSSLLESYGISKEQLFEDAVNNSSKILPPSVLPMEEMMGRLLGIDSGEELPKDFESQLDRLSENSAMTVLTNDSSVNGAAVIFYPEVMDKITERIGCDVFILPSSVHEVILVPDNGTYKLADLTEMVKSVNDNEVAPKDILSYDVLHYDRKERILERADEHELRKEDMSHKDKSEDEAKAKKPKSKDRER